MFARGGADMTGNGYVEYYGYHPSAGGWVLSGWISSPGAKGEQPERVVIYFDNGDGARIQLFCA